MAGDPNQRRHYDTIAWAISGILIPFSFYLLKLSFDCTFKPYFQELKYLGIFFMLFWHISYDRLGKSAYLEKENIKKDRNNNSVKNHDRFINCMFHNIKMFRGLGSFITFWFMRWTLVTLYIFSWIILEKKISTIIWIPFLILFSLNIWDLFIECKYKNNENHYNLTRLFMILTTLVFSLYYSFYIK